MTYKLLDRMQGHVGEARLTDVLNAKELVLKALIARRTQLLATVASRIRLFEALHSSGMTPLAEVDRQIALVQGEITTLGANFAADGTVSDPHRHGRVEYDYALEQQGLTRVYIGEIPGTTHPFSTLLRWKDGGVVDTSLYPQGALETSQPGRGIYVMSAQGHFHLSPQEDMVRHHSSLLAAGHIGCGGEISVLGGRITYLNNNSGHYLPNILHFIQVMHALSKTTIPMNFPVAAWDDNKVNGAGQPLGGVVEKPDPDGLVEHFFGAGADFEELYGYHSLVRAYGDILADRDRMNSLGLIWVPATVGSTPRGTYKVGAPGALTNVRISFHEARHIINQGANPNRLPQSRGVGTNMVSTDPNDIGPRGWGRA